MPVVRSRTLVIAEIFVEGALGAVCDVGRLGNRRLSVMNASLLADCASSSRPMSSKLEISETMPSGVENWEEEWYEDDFEDFDDKSGGESGAVETVVISYPMLGEMNVRERPKDCCSASGSAVNVAPDCCDFDGKGSD